MAAPAHQRNIFPFIIASWSVICLILFGIAALPTWLPGLSHGMVQGESTIAEQGGEPEPASPAEALQAGERLMAIAAAEEQGIADLLKEARNGLDQDVITCTETAAEQAAAVLAMMREAYPSLKQSASRNDPAISMYTYQRLRTLNGEFQLAADDVYRCGNPYGQRVPAAVVRGFSEDSDGSAFMQTFDGFRNQLRAFGLAEGVYGLVDQLFGFLHRSTGVPIPAVEGN